MSDIDLNAFIASEEAAQANVNSSNSPQGDIDLEQFVEDTTQELYGTPKQMLKTAAEGAAKGFLGSTIARTVEEKILGVDPEEIKAREEANPVTHGLANVTGLGAGLLTGLGPEAMLMTKAGQIAGQATAAGRAAELAKDTALATGLGGKAAAKAAEEAFQASPYLSRVGSSAAQQAAEMAIMQSDDEIAKHIFNDPSTTSESSIANIGLAAALGGGTGAFVTGAISPLWKATLGPKLEGALHSLNNIANGEAGVVLPEAVEKGLADLAIEPTPILRGALSGDEKALKLSQDLYRARNPKFMEHLDSLPKEMQTKVADAIGVPFESLSRFSNYEDGVVLKEVANKTISEQYAPNAAQFAKLEPEVLAIKATEDDALSLGSEIMSKANSDTIGRSSRYYKEYEGYATRVLEARNLGQLDAIRSELGGLNPIGDSGLKRAYNDIRDIIRDFQEKLITKHAEDLGEEGAKLGKEFLAERRLAFDNYKKFAREMDTLSDFLGLGEFKGAKGFMSKIDELSPETIIKKFATKGDMEGARFLQERFPGIAELVKQHEVKAFLKPFVKEVDGIQVLDIKKLSKQIESLQNKGLPEHAEYLIGTKGLEALKAADVIEDAIAKVKSVKDSGSPRGQWEMFKHMGAGAAGVIGWLAGHNPIASAAVGAMATYLGKEAPEAIKLALLKHMGSNNPVKPEAFKAMASMMTSVYKAERAADKAAESIFKTGVRYPINVPTPQDIAKLDKLVAKNEDNPKDQMIAAERGQVGHYMQEHQVKLTETTSRAQQYLSSIKPRPFKPGPLDKPIPPSEAEMARYNRALMIAEQPMMVFKHIQEGTLLPTDIQDIHGMYPQVAQRYKQKLTAGMMQAQADEEPIPYKARMSMSMFLGQPLDTTMTPANIMAAQPPPPQPFPQQPGAQRGSPSKVGKTTKQYLTPNQSSELDKAGRAD